MAGANDVTHLVRPTVSVRLLDVVVTRLTAAGSVVVWACCPDLGTVEPLPNPLRSVGRRMSRTLAAAQALATAKAGGHPVELGAILGPEFASSPSEYFSEDGFHPSSLGYRRSAEVILPVLLHALGVGEVTERSLKLAAAGGGGREHVAGSRTVRRRDQVVGEHRHLVADGEVGQPGDLAAGPALEVGGASARSWTSDRTASARLAYGGSAAASRTSDIDRSRSASRPACSARASPGRSANRSAWPSVGPDPLPVAGGSTGLW